MKLRCPQVVLQEEDILVAGFTDSVEEPSKYLMLQRPLAPTSQDIKLGHDKVYIEINDQIWSAYGNVALVSLTSNELTLRLDPSVASAVKAEELVTVEFDLDEQKLEGLRDFLARLLLTH